MKITKEWARCMKEMRSCGGLLYQGRRLGGHPAVGILMDMQVIVDVGDFKLETTVDAMEQTGALREELGPRISGMRTSTGERVGEKRGVLDDLTRNMDLSEAYALTTYVDRFMPPPIRGPMLADLRRSLGRTHPEALPFAAVTK